jgi:hypothetical protein
MSAGRAASADFIPETSAGNAYKTEPARYPGVDRWAIDLPEAGAIHAREEALPRGFVGSCPGTGGRGGARQMGSTCVAFVSFCHMASKGREWVPMQRASAGNASGSVARSRIRSISLF